MLFVRKISGSNEDILGIYTLLPSQYVSVRYINPKASFKQEHWLAVMFGHGFTKHYQIRLSDYSSTPQLWETISFVSYPTTLAVV